MLPNAMKKDKTGIELEGKRGLANLERVFRESRSDDDLEQGFGFQAEERQGQGP